MKNRAFYLFLFSIAIAFASCHKDCKKEQFPSMKFTPKDLLINPYGKINKLKFSSSDNDSLILSVKNYTIGTLTVENPPSSTPIPYGEFCGGWYNTEYNLTQCSSGGGKQYFIMEMNLPDVFHSMNNNKHLQLYLSLNDPTIAELYGKFNYDSTSLTNLIPVDTLYRSYIESLNDSVKIGPNIYLKVYKIVNEPSSETQTKYPDWITIMYYNINQGLVGFSLKSGRFYYLQI